MLELREPVEKVTSDLIAIRNQMETLQGPVLAASQEFLDVIPFQDSENELTLPYIRGQYKSLLYATAKFILEMESTLVDSGFWQTRYIRGEIFDAISIVKEQFELMKGLYKQSTRLDPFSIGVLTRSVRKVRDMVMMRHLTKIAQAIEAPDESSQTTLL